MSKTTLNVAIAGLGVIGNGVATVLEAHAAQGSPLKLVKILEKNTQSVTALPFYQRFPQLFAASPEEVIHDPEIDVIVETIGGRGFAKELIQHALEHGKHVVTANKDLMATHGQVLMALAQQKRRHLLFEASVGGAIPIIHLMQSFFSTQDVRQVMGIVNGTTNYILSQMDTNKLSFATALQQAQELGFAEQDPTNDIKGYDARYKLTILIYLATQTWLDVASLTVEGIDRLDSPDFDYAERMNRKIKLIAYFRREAEGIRAFVLPLMLPNDHPAAKVSGSTNIITVRGDYSEDISLIGRGAGSLPTASAIVSDLHTLFQRPVTPPLVAAKACALIPFEEYVFKHTLRFRVHDQPGIVGSIGTILAKYGINIYALEQLPQYHRGEQNEQVIFTLTLETCQEGLVQKALKEINAASYMAKPVSILRELTL